LDRRRYKFPAGIRFGVMSKVAVVSFRHYSIMSIKSRIR
jgi:hypothetical protein